MLSPKLSHVATCCLLALSGGSAALHAQTISLPAGSVGLSVGYAPQAYEDSRKYSAVPLLHYETERWRIAGPSVDWKAYSRSNLSFSLRARYAMGDGYDDGDEPILEGMRDRKPGVWLGGAVAWDSGAVKLSVELLGDVSGKSDGLQGKLGLEREFPYGRYSLTPYAAVAVLDRDYVDYYYGVRASEERANRSRYDGSTTVNFEVGLRASYALTPKHVFSANVGATALGDGIKDSPLVDRSVLPAVRLGYQYRF
jgi:outer membrane protein